MKWDRGEVKLMRNLWKLMFMLLLVGVCSIWGGITISFAETGGTCGASLEWNLTDEGTLTISGTGAMQEWNGTNPWYNLNVKYVVVDEGVTSLGSSAFYDCETILSISLPDTLYRIGTYAFYNCSNLVSIQIPESVTQIDSSAFYRCEKLKSISIPESITEIGSFWFEDCSSLENVIIPDTVTSIGNSSFAGCASLTSISIPQSVTSIGSYAFMNCSSLSSISIPNGLENIGYTVFSGCTAKVYASLNSTGAKSLSERGYSFSESGNSFEYMYTFEAGEVSGLKILNCEKNVTSVLIPDDVTIIGTSCFSDCLDLIDVKMPEGLVSIQQYAFKNCTSLSDLTIPNNTKSIGAYAFQKCTKLVNIKLPKQLESIDNSAFRDCTELISIDIDVDNNAFATIDGVLLSKDCTQIVLCPSGKYGFYTIPEQVRVLQTNSFYDCKNITGIDVHDNIESRDGAFYGTVPRQYINLNTTTAKAYFQAKAWFRLKGEKVDYTFDSSGDHLIVKSADKNISSVVLPDIVSSIDTNAFAQSSLRSIVLPEGIKKIGYEAFYLCRNLRIVEIPESVVEIGQLAFCGCSSLEYITIPKNIKEIPYAAFSSCYKLNAIAFMHDEASSITISKSSFSNKPTFYCYEYSDAEGFAIDNDFPVVLLNNADISAIGILVLEDDFKIAVGENKKIIYELFPNIPGIQFESSDTNIIQLSGNTVIAVNKGKATITASLASLTATVNVDAFITAESFEFCESEIWLVAKEQAELKPINLLPIDSEVELSWSISDSTIATIDEYGTIQTKKPGNAIVTAQNVNGISAAVVLHVCYPVKEIDIVPLSNIRIADKVELLAEVTTSDGQKFINHLITFESSDPFIASVDSKGVVEGKRVGSVTITAKANNDSNVMSTCLVTVRELNILTLPSGLQVIENEAFAGNDSAEAIRIPPAVERISLDAIDKRVILIIPADSKWVQWALDNGYHVIEE